MSLPWIVLPMETTLVREGLRCAVRSISSLRPPLPLYGRNTPSAASAVRLSARAGSRCSVRSTPCFSSFRACPSVRYTSTAAVPRSGTRSPSS
ncbi:hypothetical protein STENM223S_02435 [Streptomyces tendae]